MYAPRPSTLLLVLLIGVGSSRLARGSDVATASSFIAKHAKVLDEDQVFYRWQSTGSGENLAKMGTMTPAADKYFMGMTEEVMMGPGLYVAGSPLSSSEYLPQTGGNLLEVRIKKGTRVLNLTDFDTIGAMRREGLFAHDFQHWAGDDRPLMLNYTKDWFVAKNMADHATFSMYPGPQQTPTAINDALGAAEERVAKQIGSQIRAHRPGVVDEIAREHGLSPGLVRLLPDAELQTLLERSFAHSLPEPQATQVVRTIAGQQRLQDMVSKDEQLRHRAVAALALADVKALSVRQLDVLGDLSALGGETGRKLLHKTLDTLLNDRQYDRAWGALAERIVPILNHIELSKDERALVTERLGEMVKAGGVGAQVDRLQQIAHAAKIEDPSLGHDLGHMKARAQTLERARQTGSVAAVQNALADQTHIREFVDAYDHIVAVNPSSRVNAAVEGLFKDTPDVMKALIHGPEDFAVAAQFAKRIPGTFPALYAAALGATPEARLKFMSSCFDESVCAHHLGEAIVKDRGAILNGLKDLESLGEHVRRRAGQDKALVERLLENMRDPDQLASFGRALTNGGADGTHAKALVRAAREIGLDKFRTPALLDVGRLAGADARAKREIVYQSLKNAANADDVVAVGDFAAKNKLASRALTTDLAATFQRFDPAPADLEHARAAALPFTAPKQRGFECVNRLARWLGMH